MNNLEPFRSLTNATIIPFCIIKFREYYYLLLVER